MSHIFFLLEVVEEEEAAFNRFAGKYVTAQGIQLLVSTKAQLISNKVKLHMCNNKSACDYCLPIVLVASREGSGMNCNNRSMMKA